MLWFSDECNAVTCQMMLAISRFGARLDVYASNQKAAAYILLHLVRYINVLKMLRPNSESEKGLFNSSLSSQ